MLKQAVITVLSHNVQKMCRGFFAALCVGVMVYGNAVYSSSGVSIIEPQTITYYLYIDDFIDSFIEIPTATVSGGSSTLASSYLAGRAPLYNQNDEKVGVCSASFLNIQNADNIFTDISNYISVADGLIVTWFTPTTLINLELDTLVNAMVTECIVVANTKVGVAPLYGQTFTLIVSSDGTKIHFAFTRMGNIF